MLVREAVPVGGPVTVLVDDGVRHAAQVLLRHALSCVPVLDAAGHLVGVVSEADLLRDRVGHDPRAHLLVHEDGEDPVTDRAGGAGEDRPVADVMTPHPVTVDERADLADAVTLLVDLGHRMLPVVRGQHLVGVLGRRDVLRTLVADDDEVVEAVRRRLGADLPDQDWTVTAADGVVTLVGRHGPAAQRVAAVVARTVPGVRRVVEVGEAHSYDEQAPRPRPHGRARD